MELWVRLRKEREVGVKEEGGIMRGRSYWSIIKVKFLFWS